MEKQTFLSIRKKHSKLIKKVGHKKASDIIVKIMERVKVSPINYLAHAIDFHEQYKQEGLV